MAAPTVAPVLSTPSDTAIESVSLLASQHSKLSQSQLDIQYEVKRTIEEIRARRWRRIALQFPDDMLVDAPHVLVRLRDGLRLPANKKEEHQAVDETRSSCATTLDTATSDGTPVKLTILGDTSYGSCCVDEIAAEHVAADGVVHYGRSCLSPTQRLPVIYVYTARSLTLDSTISTFERTFPDKAENICLLADVPWQHHVEPLSSKLRELGYDGLVAPPISHNPSAMIPNRALPQSFRENPSALQQTAVFHIGSPPTALLLTLASRVRSFHIHDPDDNAAASEASMSMTSRRRYAALLKLSSASIIGILINTLSVKNYMSALEHVQTLITKARKKSYTFVVGKLNPAKLANFAEIGGWVVIGCWESSLIDSKDFLSPVVTPFELELALMPDEKRLWGHEWISDFQTLLQRSTDRPFTDGTSITETGEGEDTLQDQSSDDEPPEYDLRTGKYVSHSRPMAQKRRSKAGPSSALVQRAKGDLVAINGVASPGAEYLRSKREWQGLGTDFEVAYDRDEHGNIQGAPMEQGRAGVAKGYSHNDINIPS